MSIELPKDAEGREIPLDTKVLYGDSGQAYEIETYCYAVHEDMPDRKWGALLFSKKSVELKSIRTTALYLTPPDSWEELEEDLDRCIKADSLCAYSPSEECSTCILPRDSQCNCDSFALKAIKERIRNLRGED